MSAALAVMANDRFAMMQHHLAHTYSPLHFSDQGALPFAMFNNALLLEHLEKTRCDHFDRKFAL